MVASPQAPRTWASDDGTLCTWKGRSDVMVVESVGEGSSRPNIRRVYNLMGNDRAIGDGATDDDDDEIRRRGLVCRELDANLDGKKDVVRTFDGEGHPLHEEADRDFDGRIDAWRDFADGQVIEERIDSNGDGKPDVWRLFANGQLQRIRRDRNFDGKADSWEIFARGRLERIGVDETFDGRVDRWDRDSRARTKKNVEQAPSNTDSDTQSRDAGAAPASKTRGAEPEAPP